ncbi:MAG: Hsp70 family protein [bacterium]
MARIGIDLGTANSTAAYAVGKERQTAAVIEPSEGTLFLDLVFPSYVAFDRQGNYSTAGLLARERHLSGQSSLVVRHFKRLLGRPYDHIMDRIRRGDRAFDEFKGRMRPAEDGLVLISVGEAWVSVTEVASHLLRKIIDDTKIQLDQLGEEIEGVTISLPAGIDDAQRQATVAAANAAGVPSSSIRVIEEPTAAAIAKGLDVVEGNIAVIDVGAGTTDVVIGHLTRTAAGLQLIVSTRECDDTLGGMDMDSLLLEHVVRADADEPQLRDILPDLDSTQLLPLLGKIEEAKVSASMEEGGGYISRRVVTRSGASKRVYSYLTKEDLSRVAAPVINGSGQANTRQKSIRQVVERALISAAGGDELRIEEVVKELQHVILIGGPCRMDLLRDMLKDVFRANEALVHQIDVDKDDRFFMEGVAQGAALSGGQGFEVTTTVPYSVSVFSQAGTVVALPAGLPYQRDAGVAQTVQIQVHENSNQLWILSQRDAVPKWDWTMHSHVVNVPEAGELSVTLVWGEGGTETSKALVEGSGLPGAIGFPVVDKTTTLGAELERVLRWYVDFAKELRALSQSVYNWLFEAYRGQYGSDWATRHAVEAFLDTPDYVLEMCEALDVDRDGQLRDSDIEVALAHGSFEMREQALVSRGLLTMRCVESIRRHMELIWTPSTADELVTTAEDLLTLGERLSACSTFVSQLRQWLHQFRQSPNPAHGAATATAAGALAQCIFSKGSITEEQYIAFLRVFARYSAST